MGSRIWLLATVAALSLTLAACGGSDEVGAPDVGTCWAVPPDDVPDTTIGSTTHLGAVHRTAHLRDRLGAAADRAHDRRSEGGKGAAGRRSAYLGVDSDHWVHWWCGAFLPSREQIADGASWMRCDAVFPAWDLGSVRSTTCPAAGVAVDPPAELWACLDEHPKKTKQPFVPCDQPHQYEQTGGLAILPVVWTRTLRRLNSPLLPNDSAPTTSTTRRRTSA